MITLKVINQASFKVYEFQVKILRFVQIFTENFEFQSKLRNQLQPNILTCFWINFNGNQFKTTKIKLKPPKFRTYCVASMVTEMRVLSVNKQEYH